MWGGRGHQRVSEKWPRLGRGEGGKFRPKKKEKIWRKKKRRTKGGQDLDGPTLRNVNRGDSPELLRANRFAEENLF